MSRKQFYNSINSPFSFLVIVVIMVSVIQAISLFYNGNSGDDIEQTKLQKSVDNITTQMDKFAKRNYDFPVEYNFFSNKYLNQINSLHLVSYIYKGDSLVAWSDNGYIVHQALDSTKVHIYATDNAVVLVKDYKLQNFNLRLCYSLARNYKIQNEYLENRLNPNLGISKKAQINIINKKGKALLDNKGNTLAYVEWFEGIAPDSPIMVITFLLYILIVISLILFGFKLIDRYTKKEVFRRVFKALALLIILLITKYLHWPGFLYQSDIFDSKVFANSTLFDSLGSLFNISLFTFFLFVIILEYFYKPQTKIYNKKVTFYLLYGLFLISFFVLLLGLKYIISTLIFNSTISFDLTQTIDIDHLSIIGLSSIGIWIFTIYLFYIKIFNWFHTNNNSGNKFWIIEISIIVIASILVIAIHNYYYALAFYTFIIIIQYILHQQKYYQKAPLTILYLISISILISFWLYSLNYINEHNRRKSILQSVAIDQDPQAEYLFDKISKNIYKDQFLLNKIETNSIDFDSISNYIINTYFNKYQHFDKYDFQITTCTSNLHLLIQPQNIEIQCDSFFYYNLIKYGTLTNNKNLYFLQYGTGQTNYLGLFRFYEMTPDGYVPYTVYVEINSKLKRKGFTKLLSEKAYDPFEKIDKYSLATYIDGKRVETYGSYTYPEHLSWNISNEKNFEFTNKNGFDHLVFHQDKHKTFILSLKIPSSLNKLSPFSYLFLFLGLLFIVLGFISKNPIIRFDLKPNFSSRLQLTMISIIVISFAIISIITVIYIQKLNEDKNHLQLENLAKALQTEFEHKLSSEERLRNSDKEYLNELLQKFSKVFDTDINIYKTDGHLLASTRPEIFEYPLLARLINPTALNSLKIEHQGLYIAKENIGRLLYSSAYLPTHNSNGEIIGYLNLPYFAREEFLKKEISSLLSTLMNVYTLIIVLSILVILIVSNYITRPLSMLKQRMKEISMGKEIKKIEWHGIEEIKTLVDEYNQMIDALAISSEKLAKSERETAWREMAKQVAHEIKNPLTPMKLSIQYLLHSYDENAENNRDRIRSLSNTLIEQIDTLSDIATAFSDFAKMPKSVEEYTDMRAVIKSVLDLFTDYKDVNIDFECKEEQLVNIDKKQWIRVFNNLIKNSIQATEEGNKTEIKIKLYRSDNQLKITFSDNGKGIPEEMKDKIFTPNFTTKSKGAGLGLAMVKNIINNSGGEIHFASTPNIGTDFYISIPIKPTKNK